MAGYENENEDQSMIYYKKKAAAFTQGSSLFFQKLPQEIRDLIYSYYFRSTRLSHGEMPFSSSLRIRVRTAPNALALLRACRRVRAEVGDGWLGQVLFNFEDCMSMLDKLTALTADTLARIRHLRVRGDTLLPSAPGHSTHYRLTSALKLLPGLRLDTLTVLRGCSDAISYDTLGGLVAESDGWRELRYVSHTSTLLGYASPAAADRSAIPQDHEQEQEQGQDHRPRKPQPENWRNILLHRDGASSGPSVDIYRSTRDREVGSAMRPETRVPFEQRPAGSDRDGFGLEEDAALCEEGESHKELLVVVRRGRGIDYSEKEGSRFISRDIRRDVPGMTWREIRENCIGGPSRAENPDGELGGESRGKRGEVDQYHDVDEYIWSMFHFGLEHIW